MTAEPAPIGAGRMRFAQSFEAAERKSNNLTLLRFLAAGAVLFAHSWPIAIGAGAVDPATVQLQAWFGGGVAISGLAVYAFFAISGYLVTKSALTRKLGEYAAARALRIYPALIVNVLLCALVLGAAVTTLAPAAYFASESVWKFIGNNALSWNMVYRLPGVFEANPMPAVNGSLWTLPLEIRCYLLIGVLAAVGVLRRGWLFSLIAVALLVGDSVFRQLEVLGAEAPAACLASFLIGALICVNRRFLPATVAAPALLLVLAALIPVDAVARLIGLLGFVWLVLWAGLAAPRVPWIEGVIGDPSYGIYIYAFPVQQLAAQFFAAGSPLTVFAIAAPVTLVLAIASWKLIEHPVLANKAKLAGAFGAPLRVRRPTGNEI